MSTSFTVGRWSPAAIGALAGTLLVLTTTAGAQPSQNTGGACIPVAERGGRPYGCFILASKPVGALDQADAFWHLETFSTTAAAAMAQTPRSLVIRRSLVLILHDASQPHTTIATDWTPKGLCNG